MCIPPFVLGDQCVDQFDLGGANGVRASGLLARKLFLEGCGAKSVGLRSIHLVYTATAEAQSRASSVADCGDAHELDDVTPAAQPQLYKPI